MRLIHKSGQSDQEMDDEDGILDEEFSEAETDFTPFNMKNELEQGELDTLSFYNKKKSPDQGDESWIYKASAEDTEKVALYFQHPGKAGIWPEKNRSRK